MQIAYTGEGGWTYDGLSLFVGFAIVFISAVVRFHTRSDIKEGSPGPAQRRPIYLLTSRPHYFSWLVLYAAIWCLVYGIALLYPEVLSYFLTDIEKTAGVRYSPVYLAIVLFVVSNNRVVRIDEPLRNRIHQWAEIPTAAQEYHKAVMNHRLNAAAIKLEVVEGIVATEQDLKSLVADPSKTDSFQYMRLKVAYLLHILRYFHSNPDAIKASWDPTKRPLLQPEAGAATAEGEDPATGAHEGSNIARPAGEEKYPASALYRFKKFAKSNGVELRELVETEPPKIDLIVERHTAIAKIKTKDRIGIDRQLDAIQKECKDALGEHLMKISEFIGTGILKSGANETERHEVLGAFGIVHQIEPAVVPFDDLIRFVINVGWIIAVGYALPGAVYSLFIQSQSISANSLLRDLAAGIVPLIIWVLAGMVIIGVVMILTRTVRRAYLKSKGEERGALTTRKHYLLYIGVFALFTTVGGLLVVLTAAGVGAISGQPHSTATPFVLGHLARISYWLFGAILGMMAALFCWLIDAEPSNRWQRWYYGGAGAMLALMVWGGAAAIRSVAESGAFASSNEVAADAWLLIVRVLLVTGVLGFFLGAFLVRAKARYLKASKAAPG